MPSVHHNLWRISKGGIISRSSIRENSYSQILMGRHQVKPALYRGLIVSQLNLHGTEKILLNSAAIKASRHTYHLLTSGKSTSCPVNWVTVGHATILLHSALYQSTHMFQNATEGVKSILISIPILCITISSHSYGAHLSNIYLKNHLKEM